MEIATHRHGCCVLQRCIDFATPVQKKLLVAEIAANALPLSQVRCPAMLLQYCGQFDLVLINLLYKDTP